MKSLNIFPMIASHINPLGIGHDAELILNEFETN